MTDRFRPSSVFPPGDADPSAAPKVHAAIAGSALLMLDADTGHSSPNSRPELAAALLCGLATGSPPRDLFAGSISAMLRTGEALRE